MKAIHYIGMMGNEESRKELPSIYAASNNPEVKRAILKSYMISGSRDLLIQAAKTEQNPELRHEAIQQLAITGGSEQLWQLYGSESSAENKRADFEIDVHDWQRRQTGGTGTLGERSLAACGGHQVFGLMGGKGRGDVLVEIFKSDTMRV